MATPAASRLSSGTWRVFDEYNRRAAERWAVPAGRILRAEGDRAARAYAQGGEAAALAEIKPEAWLEYLTRVWLAEAPAGGRMIADLIAQIKAADLLSDTISAAALDWIQQNGAVRAAQIAGTSAKYLLDNIAAGVAARETQAEIAARIRSNAKTISSGRAAAISRTTVHASTNFGSYAAASASPVPLVKIWLSIPDDRRRDSHAAAQGQRRPMGMTFLIGGWPMIFPGDSSMGAPASETINCRCTLGYEKTARPPHRTGRPPTDAELAA